MATPTIAAYLRVSDQDQNSDGQRIHIERWLETSGIDAGKVVWYQDVMSGRTMRRPAFDRLKADIARGKVTTVVFYKLDRLARRMRDGLNLISDWCERGVRIVATSQQIDLTGTIGHIIAAVLFGLAELEWDYRRERQALGIEAARAKGGLYAGRKPGTTKGRPARAIELRAKGLSAPEIAAAMGVTTRTVFRYLEPATTP